MPIFRLKFQFCFEMKELYVCLDEYLFNFEFQNSEQNLFRCWWMSAVITIILCGEIKVIHIHINCRIDISLFSLLIKKSYAFKENLINFTFIKIHEELSTLFARVRRDYNFVIRKTGGNFTSIPNFQSISQPGS